MTAIDTGVASHPPAPARDAAWPAAHAQESADSADAQLAAYDARPLAPDAIEPAVQRDAGERDGARDAVPAPPCLAIGSGDYAMRGPYGVKRETVELALAPDSSTENKKFTIFSPEPLDAMCPHPLAAWVNGTGVTDADTYAFYHENAASWGIVVIASHDSGPGFSEHGRAIDYLLAQSREPSSRFHKKLSGRAGAGGHAQGGSIASSAATHPNVEAIISISPNGIGKIGMRAFLCLTGTNDLAPESCRIAVQAAHGPALEAIWEGADRPITPTLAGFMSGDPGTLQMMRLYAAWYRCFLADDARACELFRGGQACGICDEAGWTEIVSKNL